MTPGPCRKLSPPLESLTLENLDPGGAVSVNDLGMGMVAS
jgi:hypothetical protein